MVYWASMPSFDSIRRHPLLTLCVAAILYIALISGVIVGGGWQVEEKLSKPTYPHQRVMEASQPTRDLLIYDSEHYYNIATEGYIVGSYSTAFFPLYPLLVRMVSSMIPTDIAMLVVSWSFTVGATIFLYLWARAELAYRKQTIGITPHVFLFLLAIYPFSFFMVMGYTESLFICLTAAALYYYRTGRPWLAGIFALLSGLTRVQGLMIIA